MSETRILRDRIAELQAVMDRSFDRPAEGSAALLCRTVTDSSYPTSAGVVYAMTPVDVNGEESEGASCSYSPGAGDVIYAVNLGQSVPPASTVLIVSAVGGRWCFRFD